MVSGNPSLGIGGVRVLTGWEVHPVWRDSRFGTLLPLGGMLSCSQKALIRLAGYAGFPRAYNRDGNRHAWESTGIWTGWVSKMLGACP